MALHLTSAIHEAIRRHGEAEYPHECCGILLGRFEAGGRIAAEAVRMRNANAESPENRYLFDPREHIEVQRSARKRGLEVIGFYHSHPDHPARPSQFDLDHASWPGYSYVIVSIEKGIAKDLNAFELAEDRDRFLPELINGDDPKDAGSQAR